MNGFTLLWKKNQSAQWRNEGIEHTCIFVLLMFATVSYCYATSSMFLTFPISLHLTLSVPEKSKNSVSEIPIIPQL